LKGHAFCVILKLIFLSYKLMIYIIMSLLIRIFIILNQVDFASTNFHLLLLQLIISLFINLFILFYFEMLGKNWKFDQIRFFYFPRWYSFNFTSLRFQREKRRALLIYSEYILIFNFQLFLFYLLKSWF
jgi:hypothetical protein